MNNNDSFTVKYTFEGVIEKLDKQDEVLNEILNHAKLTNGRINHLEKVGLGNWIGKHPFKFSGICVPDCFRVFMFEDFFAVILPEQEAVVFVL